MNESSRPVAIVTGSSRGIGAAIAERLARDGHAVVINYAGRRQDADDIVERITASGGDALALQADIADPDAVQRLFDAAEARFGGVDVLVNNAGIMKLAAVADSDDALLDSQIAINLKGTFNTLRQASRRLRDGGRIVNLSTSVVGLKLESYGVYAATKAYVSSFSEALRIEVREHGIRVMALCPGPVHTEFGNVAGRHAEADFGAREWFFVPQEQVVREGLAGLDCDRPRVYPGWKVAAAAVGISLLPLAILRIVMATRPRK